MSSTKLSTEKDVKFRVQAWIPPYVMAEFKRECANERRNGSFILAEILVERYGKKSEKN